MSNQYLGEDDNEVSLFQKYSNIFSKKSFPISEKIIIGFNVGAIITSTGHLYTWGDNRIGQLGDESILSFRNYPVNITKQFNLTIKEKIHSIVFGNASALALTSNGRVFSWGNNNYGQLGNASSTNSFKPIEITDNFNLKVNENIIIIESGLDHFAAITSKGSLFIWGSNAFNKLGNGQGGYSNIPTEITSNFKLLYNEQIVSVKLGSVHSVAITNKSRIFIWGGNSHWQLGDIYRKKVNFFGIESEPEVTNISNPTELDNNRFKLTYGEIFIKISCGDFHTVAITSNNRVFLWGKNDMYQIGTGDNNYKQKTVEEITNKFKLIPSETIVDVQLSRDSSYLLTSKGRLFFWGNSEKLIVPKYNLISEPTDITHLFNLKSDEKIVQFSSSGIILYIQTNFNRIITNMEILGHYYIHEQRYYKLKNFSYFVDYSTEDSDLNNHDESSKTYLIGTFSDWQKAEIYQMINCNGILGIDIYLDSLDYLKIVRDNKWYGFESIENQNLFNLVKQSSDGNINIIKEGYYRIIFVKNKIHIYNLDEDY